MKIKAEDLAEGYIIIWDNGSNTSIVTTAAQTEDGQTTFETGPYLEIEKDHEARWLSMSTFIVVSDEMYDVVPSKAIR